MNEYWYDRMEREIEENEKRRDRYEDDFDGFEWFSKYRWKEGQFDVCEELPATATVHFFD